MKFLKSNIFIFFILGLFFSMLTTVHANWNNFQREDALEYWLIYIGFILCYLLPFFIATILNLIIKFSKSEKVQKVFKTIMKITNVLSVILLSYVVSIEFLAFCLFSDHCSIWDFLLF